VSEKNGKQKIKKQKTNQNCRESGKKKNKNVTDRIYSVFCYSHHLDDALDGEQVLAAIFLYPKTYRTVIR